MMSVHERFVHKLLELERQWANDVATINNLALATNDPEKMDTAIRLFEREARIFLNHAENLKLFLKEIQ